MPKKITRAEEHAFGELARAAKRLRAVQRRAALKKSKANEKNVSIDPDQTEPPETLVRQVVAALRDRDHGQVSMLLRQLAEKHGIRLSIASDLLTTEGGSK